MAWTAGSDVSTSDLITVANWNVYMGATGSLEYLKTEADRLDDLSVDAAPVRVKDTEYQNLSGKTRYVAVTLTLDNTEDARALIAATSPPWVNAGEIINNSGQTDIFMLFFLVPDNWYYKVLEVAGGITITDWVEWEEH